MKNVLVLFIILLTIGCKESSVKQELEEMKNEKPVDPIFMLNCTPLFLQK